MAEPTTGETMTSRAQAFLAALSDEQRASATFGFPDNDTRRDWAYFPRDHTGLPLHDMDRGQQKLAHALLSSGLSLHAYAQATTIMGIESVLNEIEGRRLDHWRDPGRYFFRIFGAPGEGDWGWQTEGHHINLNYTFAGGELVSATPLFLGANPAAIRHGDSNVIRPCAEEEDLARELMGALEGDQRSAAILTANAPFDFVLVNAPGIPERMLPGEGGGFPPIQAALAGMREADKQALAYERSAPKGVAASRMTDRQREVLRRLIGVYTDRVPPLEAAARFAEIDTAFDGLHFAWAGSLTPLEGHYYRVQGPSLLIEYDNTQDGANHVHTVWRDVAHDFGMDALRAHLQQHHSH